MLDLVKYQFAPSGQDIRFAFSLHKCGSSLLNDLVKDVCQMEEIGNVNIPGPMFLNGVLEKEWAVNKELVDALLPGYIYHSFRGLPQAFVGRVDFGGVKSVLLLRDPRDAMVSEYFSFMPGGSHIVPNKNSVVIEKRKAGNTGLSIDEYAVKYIHLHKKKLQVYADTLDFETVKVFRYEDIYYDKLKFVTEIFEYWGYQVSPATLQAVAAKRDIRPAKEDPSKHIRKGTPGDHIEKLSADTTEYISDLMRPLSSKFGYRL